jgi:1-acyl-sn-glycerol-3-phosphate acyltransferase
MPLQNKFDKIRPFYDHEVQAALSSILEDPMLQKIMRFTFPNETDAEWKSRLKSIYLIEDFKRLFVSKVLYRVLETTSSGLTSTGFEQLDKKKAYLFISNHRDIVLDASLINLTLYEQDIQLTASAIGDNLVRQPFLNTLAKINRNFLVLRGLSPRELLQSSRLMSEYIYMLLTQEHRSVWLAQREGRAKDGNDATHPGVLKMLAIAAEKEDLISYFKRLNIAPIAISYEYDPTDALKIIELLAKARNEKYVKAENEDFNSIAAGILGEKKGIHISVSSDFNDSLHLLEGITNTNQQIKAITQLIDNQIIKNYKLWASNYIAADLLAQADTYSDHYSTDEKAFFIERMQKRIDTNNLLAKEQFLSMYANPVIKKQLIFANT